MQFNVFSYIYSAFYMPCTRPVNAPTSRHSNCRRDRTGNGFVKEPFSDCLQRATEGPFLSWVQAINTSEDWSKELHSWLFLNNRLYEPIFPFQFSIPKGYCKDVRSSFSASIMKYLCSRRLSKLEHIRCDVDFIKTYCPAKKVLFFRHQSEKHQFYTVMKMTRVQ